MQWKSTSNIATFSFITSSKCPISFYYQLTSGWNQCTYIVKHDYIFKTCGVTFYLVSSCQMMWYCCTMCVALRFVISSDVEQEVGNSTHDNFKAIFKDHSGYGLGQWEQALLYNAFFHWPSLYQKSLHFLDEKYINFNKISMKYYPIRHKVWQIIWFR